MKSLLGISSTLLLLLSLLASSSVSAQEYKKITRLGTSEAVCVGGVETEADLQNYVANNEDAVRAILADSGWMGNSDDFIKAIANGEAFDASYPSGTRMAWMGAKKGGQYVALPYREWAGSTSMDAFQLNLSSGCQIYELAIPKACCNIALVSVSPDNSAECQPVAAAPVAAASTSEPEASKAIGLVPFIGLFAGSETRPRFEEAWQMDMKDSSSIYGVKAGLMKGLSPKTSAFAALSYYDRGGINSGNTYPEDNIALDIGLDRKISERAFIGGGIGAWNIDDSDYRDASLFGHVGGDIGSSNFQWILEGRIFDSDSDTHDSISDNKMFSAGIRYLIR